jgi:hypothetical protein
MSALDIYTKNIIRRWGVIDPRQVDILSQIFHKMAVDLIKWINGEHSMKKYIRDNFGDKFEEIYNHHDIDPESAQYKTIYAYLIKYINIEKTEDKTIRRCINLLVFTFVGIIQQKNIKLGMNSLGVEYVKYFNKILR